MVYTISIRLDRIVVNRPFWSLFFNHPISRFVPRPSPHGETGEEALENGLYNCRISWENWGMRFQARSAGRRCGLYLRTLSVSAAIIFFLSSGVCWGDADKVYKESSPSVVVIIAIDREGRSVSQGSGFVVREDGAVVTNYHVISRATEIKIKIGSKVLDIEGVLYVDLDNDLALLKIGGTGYPTVRVGDANALLVGEKVYVIGSPQGLENTISEGILSGIREAGSKRKLLQMTAPISPGSSGGPVFNERGEVVGIATFLIEANQNLNFALPINLVEPGLSKKDLVNPRNACQVDFTQTATCYYYQGLAYGTLGQYGKAADAFSRALTVDPKRIEIYVNLAISYANLGRYQEAVDMLTDALKSQPGEPALLNALAAVYSQMGKFQEAIATLKKSAAIKADSPATYYGLATTYGKMNRYREAVEAAKEAIDLDPESAEVQGFLGYAYTKLNMHAEAAAAFKAGIRLDPNDPRMHFGLGKAYALMGDRASALEEYKMLKNLDPKSGRELFDLIYK
jgi:tetratricopeptide (TPR) repeat protein